MQTTTAAELVTLRGGLIVPLPAVVFLLDLEARGFTVHRDADSIVVRPGSRLTPTDKRIIAEYKPALLALVDYCEQVQ